jgi:hypothetical protein
MKTLLVTLLTGVLFGYGLSLSTMVQPEIVLDFLTWRDLGLLLVLGAGVCVVMLGYQLLPRVLRAPLLGGSFGKHAGTLTWRTVVGAAVFGVGWGLSGVCPGPAIAGLGVGNWALGWAVVGLLAGAWLQGVWAGE